MAGMIKVFQCSAAAAMVAMSAAGAFAQDADTTYAYVPFRVNVNAKVTAVQGIDTVSMNAAGRTSGADTLKLPLEISIPNAVLYAGGTQGRLTAPVITSTNGNITLRLPPQSYQNAEIAMHAVNGKRVLRGKAASTDAASSLPRRNVAAGVYMLSVKGADGNMFSARLTHGGGNVNINVAFGNENAAPERRLEKSAAAGDWEITVSAAGYVTHIYALRPAAGINGTQVINLDPAPPSGNTFTDSRDQKVYKKVTIGTQTWMAENLNYAASGSKCYGDNTGGDSQNRCGAYGRLYTIATAANNSAGSAAGVRGVCPSGWHLPSDADWDKLFRYADGTSGAESPYNSPTAGRYLKAKDGWNNCGPAGSGKTYLCEDTYGFSALPGGDGYANGSFNYVGDYGGWWSVSENNSGTAYHRNMNNNSDVAGSSDRYGDGLFSVRCVQD